MALTTMTPEWKRIADDVLIYIIRQRQQNEAQFQLLAQSPRMLYNRWASSRGTAIENAELALWCLNYMQELANMPVQRLIKAAKIDNLIS